MQRLIVIGNGMAGQRLLEELIQREAPYAITVFGGEPSPAYNRIGLSSVLAGDKSRDELAFKDADWYRDNGIELHTGEWVTGVDRQTREVISAKGRHGYDHLVFATGSAPFVPPIDGADKPGVHVFRDLDDVDALLAASDNGGNAVVIGGGLLGLEAAAGLAGRGMQTTVLQLDGWLMNQQLDLEAGGMLAEVLRQRGVDSRCNVSTDRIGGDGRVEAVHLADGSVLPADLVVIAAGIRPQVTLARDAGLEVVRGIVVDDQLRTDDPNISAVGECAQHRGVCYGLVAPLYEQAAVLAASLCGEEAAYLGSSTATRLKVSGIDLYSCGAPNASDAESLVLRDPNVGRYRKLLLRDNRLVGAVLYGEANDGPWYADLMDQGTDLGDIRDRLIFGQALCEQSREAAQATSPGEQVMTAKRKLLIVGNGMVGHHFVTALVDKGGLAQFDVEVFGGEPRAAYDRVHLSEFFGGTSAEELSMVEPGYYEKHGITLHLNAMVASIDPAAKSLTTESGESHDYDELVLATGSYPFVPPIPGNDRPNCLVYRTIEDLEAIQASAQEGKVGVVVGGGLLGLEAANALKQLGLETHVVEFAPRLMPVQLDEGGGGMLRRKIEALGVQVHTQMNTKEIVDGETCRHRMNFADETHLETDVILFSAGIRPWDQLGRDAGLDMGERGGIVVNNQCRTSDEHIYAIGEVALWNKQIFGLVGPGYTMAKAAVGALLGDEEAAFTGADMSTKLKLLGVDVGSIGDAHARTPGALVYSYVDEADEVYKRIVVSADKKHLLGAVLVGDNGAYDTLLQYALNGIELPKHPDSLILPQRDGAAPAGLGPDALPDTAGICSCHNVTKGGIVAAIEGGCCSLADVKGETKASTGCGGCAQMLKSVVDHELSKRGVEVSKDICEHFPHTRQELYHLIKVAKIKSFQELLHKHGKGRGCDICKPAVASILAATWNDYILKDEHHGLQDTNDRYLANMQKDGTYSVVPRVPGGEITPDQLIAIGQVGKKYSLYTKITGGQRVDLFGARLEELPDIWKELIDAGLETGHAYGKSVRTVKSCVGSTWCRYGVQDSVGMAIKIEHRYKGLRAPHKLKFAVSGCTRECAEAQSKDIGVIATDKGWNLYVCGNGGMKPRHADLFATDLDDQTLIKYIDRVLMFYIRTADRLQRTARWLESLDGGLDYLREVVIEDSLGIGEELEAQMEHVVGTYQCEWKTTIEDPQKLKRFRSFVNAPDAKDDNVVFIEERGQIRPATEDEKQKAVG